VHPECTKFFVEASLHKFGTLVHFVVLEPIMRRLGIRLGRTFFSRDIDGLRVRDRLRHRKQ
jgi:hypothetical protein